MKARAIVWAWFVLFLLAVSAVSAAEDFTATGTARITSFACSPAEGNITIFNTGDVPSGYDLVAEGNAKSWVQFNPESFVLNPGQGVIVQEFFQIPCDAEDTPLDVAVRTEELELILGQDVIVQTPNNINLIPQTFTQEVLPCDPADFSFILDNPAEFAETYHLSVEDAPAQTALSDKSLTLLPHTNETIAITVSPKDCTLAGEFNPALIVKTDKTKLSAEIGMFLRINDSDIPRIAEGIERIRAGFEPQEASFEIFNEGNRPTTYLLSAEGAQWITLQPEQVTVPARDSKNVKLIMKPTEGTAAGTYDVILTAMVEATGKEYTKELIVKLGPPTIWERLVTDLLGVAIALVLVLAVLIWLIVKGVKKYNSPEAQQRREERRAMREQARMERIALKEAKRKQREEEKEAKEEAARKAEEAEARAAEKHERELERERLKAQRDYDKQLRKEHLVIHKDDIITGIKQTGKRFAKLLLLILILIVIGVGLSYQQVIAQNANALLLGLLVLVVILIVHRIRRRKMARARWKLAVANTELQLNTKWGKGLTQLTFMINTVIKKLVVTVKRCKPSVAPAAEGVYQTFVISNNAESDIVSGARLTFCVKKSWMMRSRVSPDAVRLMKLENDRWQAIVAEPVSTDDKYVYFTAETDSFGEFAIVGKPGKKLKAAQKKPIAAWVGKTVFGVVALIALITLVVMLPSPQTGIGIPAQVWKQDTQQTLDLAKYFHDPDMDKLLFTATGNKNIDITFIGAKALLSPHYGWAGLERVVFTADDGKGGVVKSNPVDLVVQSNIVPNAWKRFAGPIFTVAVILLIILGVILYRKQLLRIVGLRD